MSKATADRREYFFPMTIVKYMAGMTQIELEGIFNRYPDTRPGDGGVPIFALMRALNAERRALSTSCGIDTSIIGASSDELQYERKLSEEKLLKEKILNQTKLGILIPKKQAENRIKTLLKTIMSMLKNTIKEVSPKLEIGIEPRVVEAILTDSWNSIVEELKKSAKILSWDEDGAVNLQRTKMLVLADDPDFMKYLNSSVQEGSESVEVDNELFEEVEDEI
jgi:hypothetical protein